MRRCDAQSSPAAAEVGAVGAEGERERVGTGAPVPSGTSFPRPGERALPRALTATLPAALPRFTRMARP